MDRYRITPTCHTHLSPPQPTNLSKPPPPSLSSPPLFRLRRTEEAELGIFGAERYYGAGHSSSATKRPAVLASPRPSSVDGYGRIYRNESAGTPTASSVASWNSHSGLLANAPRSVAAFPLKGPRKGNYAAVGRRLFRRSCFCGGGGGGGGGAVEVAEKFSEPKSPLRPSSVYGNSKQSVETTVRVAATGDRETKREVGFEEGMKVRITPGNWPKGDNFTHRSTLYYAKKPLLLAEIGRRMVNSAERGSVDGPRAPENAPTAAAPDDAASDASSDLFELESFSAQRRQRGSLDELLDPRRRLGGAAASECAYAPSEASVVWSVATAEPPGLDRTGSAPGELRFDPAERDRFRMSLLSCRSDEAVSVGPGPVRFGPEPGRVTANGKAGELRSVRILGPARAK
ncbi:protein PHYTOCHROME KINASE SUBSTRATE 4-like [Ananas comosus]|uniref:Protein PHYTOCHROME KINASE SUBSTRATE 4-like n=1 Tax=Ananas comosus TaxID=4615 RepID=A0A6P5GKX0_ANACO|nr:protein PHYTOCHROME KINASE SUBSTRATE 4-like [Ananas comosus]